MIDRRAFDKHVAYLADAKANASIIAGGGATATYESIDLSRLSYRRVLDNAPYPELGII